MIVDTLQARWIGALEPSFYAYTEQKATSIPRRTRTQEVLHMFRSLFLMKHQRPTLELRTKREMFYGARDDYLMLFPQRIRYLRFRSNTIDGVSVKFPDARDMMLT